DSRAFQQLCLELLHRLRLLGELIDRTRDLTERTAITIPLHGRRQRALGRLLGRRVDCSQLTLGEGQEEVLPGHQRRPHAFWISSTISRLTRCSDSIARS